MNWIDIVTCAIVAFFGGYEVIKLLLTRKSEKKKASAEADKAEQEAKYNGINDEYQRIIEAYRVEIDNLQEQLAFAQEHMKGKSEMIEELQQKMTDLVASHQEQIIIKQGKIEELMENINNLTSKITALTLLRCNVTSCPKRVPPLSEAASLQFENGLIKSDDIATE